MKGLGAVLVLCGALWIVWLRRRETLAPIRMARALMEDLTALSYQICVLRRPLPELLEGTLTEGPGAVAFWKPLLERIHTAGERGASLPACWRQAAEPLPAPLGRILAPLGELLPAGGGRLAAAIEETREELARFLREETVRAAQQARLTAALCFAGAFLLILVSV